jgi:DNA-binding response OmpR family regulator
MKTILIIDDESYFAKSVEATLDPKKYKVIAAVNGEEGLAMVEKFSPDAVLLDINMPKMNGMEVLKHLDTKKFPVIITSNLSSRETISDGVAMGVRGYIIKSNESLEAIASTIEGLFN